MCIRDSMKNGQLKPGYNVNVATVSEYIIGNYISADRTDTKTFIPFLEKLCRKHPVKRVVVDSGDVYKRQIVEAVAVAHAYGGDAGAARRCPGCVISHSISGLHNAQVRYRGAPAACLLHRTRRPGCERFGLIIHCLLYTSRCV